MSDVTQILSRIEAGDPAAADQLLPLVYDELRKLAASRLARENPGQTLEATALVHEAYLRLLGPPASGAPESASGGREPVEAPTFDSRGHFFSAAAEAMRRILVDHARSRHYQKRGGDAVRVTFDEGLAVTNEPSLDFVALDDALEALATFDERKSRVIELRFFGGEIFLLGDATMTRVA